MITKLDRIILTTKAIALAGLACGPNAGTQMFEASSSGALASSSDDSSSAAGTVSANETSSGQDGETAAEVGTSGEECGDGTHDGDLVVLDDTPPDETMSLTHVVGDVLIEGTDGLQDLSSLAKLKCVDGNLRIVSNANLRSLDGLDMLHRVGGQVWVIDNPVLLRADALAGLQRLAGLQITGNADLVQLPRLADGVVFSAATVGLEVGNNRAENLDEFLAGSPIVIEADVLRIAIYADENLRSVDLGTFADADVTIQVVFDSNSASVLEEIDLSGLHELDSLMLRGSAPGLTMVNAPDLQRARSIYISGNHGLEDLTGFSELEEVTESLILGCDTPEPGGGALQSLIGLGALTSVPHLMITGLPELVSLAGPSTALRVDRVDIMANTQLSTDEAEAFAVAVGADEVEICGNAGEPPCPIGECVGGMGD